MTIANQTDPLGARSDQVPPALNSTVYMAIWTSVSEGVDEPGDQRPSSTMCSAKSTAHANTSKSPAFIPDGPPVSITSPTSETNVADHVHQWMGAPNSR